MYSEYSENMCGSVNPPKQISQTEKELKIAEDNSRILIDSISLLEEKIKLILRSSTPCIEEENIEKEQLVPIAESFKKLGNKFIFANNKIRNLIERVEI